jgi:hypothetical protein
MNERSTVHGEDDRTYRPSLYAKSVAPAEAIEQPHCRLHLGVWVQDDAVLDIMGEADRDHLLEFAAAGTENRIRLMCGFPLARL